MPKGNFFSDIIDWTKEAEIEIATETANVTKTIFKSIVLESPVRTGRFMFNWQIGPDSPNNSILGTTGKEGKYADIDSTITANYFLTHDRAYMINNTAYAWRVEYEGWRDVGGRGEYAPVGKTIGKFSGGV